jgi:hypothetical protein
MKTLIVSGMGPAQAPEAKKGSAMLIPKAPKLILKGMSKMLVNKPETAEFIAEQLPACLMDMKRDEGHLSLIYNHDENIFLTFSEHGKD